MDKRSPESPEEERDSEMISSDSMDGSEEEMVIYAPIGFGAEDEPDNILTQPQRSSEAFRRQWREIPNPLSEEKFKELEKYNMNHSKRGTALIFNHIKFQYHSARKGAEQDGIAMRTTLQELGFDVCPYEDKTSKEITGILNEAVAKDHSDCDCLLIAFMTHGSGGGILCTYDDYYQAEDVCKMFTSDKVPSLAGKPKIFLFQACRGQQSEKSSMCFDSTDNSICSKPLVIPANADFLVAHSSIEGYTSLRNQHYGSWFIQSLCKDIIKSAREKDFLSILTDSLRRVSYNRFSRNKVEKKANKQEMPMFSSTLTRKMFFYDTAQ